MLTKVRSAVDIQWATCEDERNWAPRLRAVRALVSQLEWRSVAAGIRRCALLVRSHAQLQLALPELLQAGLVLQQVHEVRLQEIRRSGEYTGSRGCQAVGEATNILAVVATCSADAVLFIKSWNTNDHDAIGHMLGYPSCCRAFFNDVWTKPRRIEDPTWRMATNTSGGLLRDNTCLVEGFWECNVLLRWIGARPVLHLPCSFKCVETVKVARRLLSTAATFTDGAVLADLQEMLSWDTRWRAVGGVAHVHTPALSIQAGTDLAHNACSCTLRTA